MSALGTGSIRAKLVLIGTATSLCSLLLAATATLGFITFAIVHLERRFHPQHSPLPTQYT